MSCIQSIVVKWHVSRKPIIAREEGRKERREGMEGRREGGRKGGKKKERNSHKYECFLTDYFITGIKKA